jgi:hypothetical protein
MCCPKGKGECQYFIFLTLKKKKFMDTGSWIFFNKKLILDYYLEKLLGKTSNITTMYKKTIKH